jgi:hypothetical protein
MLENHGRRQGKHTAEKPAIVASVDNDTVGIDPTEGCSTMPHRDVVFGGFIAPDISYRKAGLSLSSSRYIEPGTISGDAYIHTDTSGSRYSAVGACWL